MPINLDDHLKHISILHNDEIDNYNDALFCLIRNKDVDAVTYFGTTTFSINNIAILNKDKDGFYFFNYSMYRIGDMFSDITILNTNISKNIKLDYYIGGIRYNPEDFEKLLSMSMMLQEITLRFTFLKKPSNDDEFGIRVKYWVFKDELRKKLKNSEVILGDNLYKGNMVSRSINV